MLRDRGFVKQAGVSMVLVLACAVPPRRIPMILFGGVLERAIVVRWMTADPLLSSWSASWQWVSMMARYTLVCGITSMVAAILYYFDPTGRSAGDSSGRALFSPQYSGSSRFPGSMVRKQHRSLQ